MNTNKKILIIGGVALGMSCATRLRRLDEFCEIIVFEKDDYISFANCGLPYYIGGEIKEREELILQTPEKIKNRFNIDVRNLSEVIDINNENQTITIFDKKNNKEYTENYTELVIATGADPLLPPIPGINLENNFIVRNVQDVDNITNFINLHPIKKAVICGGGFIGLEMAEQLHLKGIQVSVVEALNQVMAPLDLEMANYCHSLLKKHGIEVYLNNPVQEFKKIPNSLSSNVILKDGSALNADICIISLGVRPNVKLAKKIGLDLTERGSIKVNDYLQTSINNKVINNIWAGGDAIATIDPITKEERMVALGGPANRQGRLIADNIALKEKKKYKGTIGTSGLRLFDELFLATGVNEKTLQRLNIPYLTCYLYPKSHAGYYPHSEMLQMKLLFSPENRKVLGAQIIGKKGADKRIDVLSTAIYSGLTVDDLIDLELAYAPPFGSAKDAVNMAGMIAQNMLDHISKNISASSLLDSNANLEYCKNNLQFLNSYTTNSKDEYKINFDGIIIDVREEKEFKDRAIPSAINIPLNQIREKILFLKEQNKKIAVYCRSGQRSYNAYRILKQYEFDCFNITGAYLSWLSFYS